jgi:hypothetical protein
LNVSKSTQTNPTSILISKISNQKEKTQLFSVRKLIFADIQITYGVHDLANLGGHNVALFA